MSIESRSRQYGKVFDHWQIKEFLGSGSGGKTAVFRLQRSDSSWGACALKIVNLIEERGSFDEIPDFHKKEYEVAREECSRSAEQEVRLMDELRGNTNIVDYLDHTFVDWSEEDCFGRDLLIRMELLTDLRSELRRGKNFTEAETLKVGRDICTALIRCHGKNILHRDVKPENIFRNKDGDYKLGDFGVSRVLDACPGAVASTGIGTYEYWPSEQMTGSYDKRVDIYSLGLVLYELSNRNRLPFAASTYVTGKEVSLRLSGAPMTEPTEVSPALARVILKACAFRPEDRYQSAEDFLKALDWVSRKEKPANHMAVPEPRQQAAERFETIPARPDAVPKKAFETQPARGSESFETAPARPERTTGGSYLKEPKRKKKKKAKIFPVLLVAMILCAGAGMFAGPKIGRYVQYSSAKAFMEEGKYDQAVSAFEALGDYKDSAKQMENAQLAVDYETAKTLMEEGKYDQAVSAFEALGNYQDSAEQMENAQLAVDYEKATALLESGKYEEAISAFEALNGYQDSESQITEAQRMAEYAAAEQLEEDGKTAEAAMAFYALGEKEHSFELWSKVAVQDTISAGTYFTVGLKTDGTVSTAGEGYYDRSDLDDWANIIAVSVGHYNVAGLKKDHTVIAVGTNSLIVESNTLTSVNNTLKDDVSNWTDIVSVCTGGGNVVGLKANGTVVTTGDNSYGQCSVGSWRHITAVSTSGLHTVGLKVDGTVVATGDNSCGQCDVGNWIDIVAVCAGGHHTVGLKADGTVIAVGNNDYGQCAVSNWTDVVAVSAGSRHTVGLKADGTVVAVGRNLSLQCNVGEWRDIVAITAGLGHTVGLKSDGTTVSAGTTSEEAQDRQKWPRIMLPYCALKRITSILTEETTITSIPTGVIAVGYANEDTEIRSGAGLGCSVIGSVKNGENVVIYESKLEGGLGWGRTDLGWVCTPYLSITGIGSAGSGKIGTIDSAFTRIRSEPTSGSTLISKVMVSSQVVIYETSIEGTETWGRTDLGWINMQDVTMGP